jgi:hypothetical protein
MIWACSPGKDTTDQFNNSRKTAYRHSWARYGQLRLIDNSIAAVMLACKLTVLLSFNLAIYTEQFIRHAFAV